MGWITGTWAGSCNVACRLVLSQKGPSCPVHVDQVSGDGSHKTNQASLRADAERKGTFFPGQISKDVSPFSAELPS